MRQEATREKTTDGGGGLRRGLGLSGRVAVLWAVAGGVALGGFATAGMTLAGRLSASGLFMTSGALFLVGAVLGYLHGSALGYFGRPEGWDSRAAAADIGKAALYAIPAAAVAWVVSGWIAMTTVGLYVDEALVMLVVGAAWLVGAGLVAAAAWQGVRALANAYARWPMRRAGTLLVAATYAALLVTFLADRPELWGVDLRVTETGAVLLATGLTFWVAGPLVTVALRLLSRLPAPRPSPGFSGGWRTNLVLGLAVGGALALVAVPFHQAPLGVPAAAAGSGAAAAVILAASQALVDEVLLRLVLMTGVVWLLLRWHSVHREEAALAGVIGIAVLQVALYAPGLMEIGFPTTAAALGYTAANVLLPAAVFGALYWLRGLGTAVVADATALTALALLV